MQKRELNEVPNAQSESDSYPSAAAGVFACKLRNRFVAFISTPRS